MKGLPRGPRRAWRPGGAQGRCATPSGSTTPVDEAREGAWLAGGDRWLEEHGGELPPAASAWGGESGGFLDVSVSVNPFGPPPGALRAAARCLRRGGSLSATAYPPRDGRPLREALAARLGVPPECCLLANGGAEAIHLLIRAAAPRRLVVLVPCFGEYARAAAALDIPVAAVPLAAERGFAVGGPELEALSALLRAGDLLFLANPNNPTGRLVPPDGLAYLVELARRRRALLAVDEAFLPLAAEEAASLAGRAAAGEPAVVVGSLTKVYALPGLRLGYLVGGPALVAAARRQQPPWAVNGVALAAALACLAADGDGSLSRRARERLAREREWLRRRLGGGGRVVVYPSDANFLLLRVASSHLAIGAAAGGAETTPSAARPPAAAAGEETARPSSRCPAAAPAAVLARLGVLVRDCSSFPGLGPAFVRVAVGRRAANRRLAEALLSLG